MLKKTVLHDLHVQANGKMVEFAGYAMPLHYGSQIEEHHIVRKQAGIFDVSHMGVVECSGKDSQKFLMRLIANDVRKITPGKALYTCMLNENGGIIDDLIVYQINPEHFRLVVNAGTKENDLQWMQQQIKTFDVKLRLRDDLSILALQGPQACDAAAAILKKHQLKTDELKPFHLTHQGDWLAARTGYTGEDGYELILPTHEATQVWKQLVESGFKPCGLGSRDTLRLEAGLNLYGQDMDIETTPLESNLAWTVVISDDRDFIGKKALLEQKAKGTGRILVGLILVDKGVLRHHQQVFYENQYIGVITSGGYAPTLAKSIAFARLERNNIHRCEIDIRGKWLKADVVRPPFVRKGQILVGV